MKTNIFLSSLSSQNSETLALASRAASASAAKLLCSFIGTEQSLTFYDRNKIFRAVFTLQSKISLAFDLWSLICQSKITKWILTANYLDPLNDHPPASSYLFKFILVRNTQFRMLDMMMMMMMDSSDLKFNSKWYMISWPILYFHLDSPGDRFPLGQNFPKGVVPQYIPDQLRFSNSIWWWWWWWWWWWFSW